MYKAIVFDLDGTLLDTLDDLTAAVNAALLAFDLPQRTREEVRGFVGNGIAKLMKRAVGIADYPRFDEILQTLKDYYGAHCQERTKPYDGIMPILQTLKKQGFLTAVLSNKADFATKKLVAAYFPNLFAEAIGENESAGIAKKPSPTSLFAVMEQLGVQKGETVYVGDSEVDIQTAQNAGVDCISVTWGFKTPQFLTENGATTLVDTPSQLLALLLGNEKKEI